MMVVKANNLKKGMNRNAAKKVQQAVAGELATRILDMHVNGRMSMTEIAGKIGYTVGRVCQIITERKKEWKEARLQALDDQQDEAMALLNNLHGIAYHCFRLSQQPSRESAREQERRLQDLEEGEEKLAKAMEMGNKKNGKPCLPKVLVVPAGLKIVGERDKDTTRSREEGNPRFLDILKWCVEVRLKMCGLLTTTELNVDARQGVFAEQLQQFVVPPPVPDDQRPDPVAMRLEALAIPEESNEQATKD